MQNLDKHQFFFAATTAVNGTAELLNRNRGILSDEALAEYAEAKAMYEELLERAE